MPKNRTIFQCDVCQTIITHLSTSTTGYGIDLNDRKVCFDCCAIRDRRDMIQSGIATLYLSEVAPNKGWVVSNWSGTLSFIVKEYRKGKHNMAGNRYDVWFEGPAGFIWHGVQYGDFNQIVRCKRTKKGKYKCH